MLGKVSFDDANIGQEKSEGNDYLLDWVWTLELNGEIADKVTNRVGGNPTRIGGKQLFLSPGLMWTYCNAAIKAGIQIPVYDDLAADQAPDDYRVLLEFEWHL